MMHLNSNFKTGFLLKGLRLKVGFTAVGRACQRLLPLQRDGSADADHQGAVCMEGPTEGQGIHVLREQGLVGKRVTDTSIIKDLKRAKEVSEGGQGSCAMVGKIGHKAV